MSAVLETEPFAFDGSPHRCVIRIQIGETVGFRLCDFDYGKVRFWLCVCVNELIGAHPCTGEGQKTLRVRCNVAETAQGSVAYRCVVINVSGNARISSAVGAKSNVQPIFAPCFVWKSVFFCRGGFYINCTN